MSGLRIDVADLLTHPGARREISLDDELEALHGTSAAIEGPVHVDAWLERISDGIVVRGTVEGRWRAECSVCLRELERELAVHVDELFEPNAVEGETYPLEGRELDFEQLVRDALLLELPLAPHCDEPCEPTDTELETDEPVDPRWAPLAELDLSPKT